MSRVRQLFSREKIENALRRLGGLRIKASHATLLELLLLVLILTLAFTVRLLPMRWGYYISEFDPYYQYRLTKDVVENGFLHWTTWQDTMSWWPWGRDIAYTSFPGLPYAAAALYSVCNALGIPMVPTSASGPLASDPVYNFVIMFPVIMAVLTCLALFFWAKDIGGKEVGLFAAFFLALNGSHIGRTSLGFFDDETVGIFSIVLYSFLFLRAVEKERSMKSCMIYSIAAGVTLGYLFGSWGASRYPLGLTMLFVLVLLFLRRYSSRLLIAYSTTNAIALFMAINVPKLLGFRFLLEITNVAVFGVFALLCTFEIGLHVKTARMKGLFVVGVAAAGIAAFAALFLLGYVQPLAGRYLNIVNPFGGGLSNPILVSVQEHQPAAWGTIYYDLGLGILFIPVGFYFAAQNPTDRNIYLILFGLTSIYFASTFVRLTLILAPALCVLWALALSRVLRPFITLLREKPMTFKTKMRIGGHVGREFSAAFLILMFLLLTLTFVFPSTESRARGESFPRVLEQAYAPVTIAAASLPIRPDQASPDWFDALNWMYYNLPSDAVVASWWDYGYWITTIADKRSLVDNATWNTTQIQQVGLMFMSNETGALQVLDNFNRLGNSRGSSSKVDYIVAFFTFDSSGNDVGYGEESKWRWMANIAFDDLKANERFGNYTLGRDWSDTNADGQIASDGSEFIDNALGRNTTLYQMMQLGKSKRVSSITANELTYFELVYWSQKDKASATTVSGINALVTIWRVRR
jgi:dolichyl-diphosphooligosaccharide--protein glycosyltransferase